MFDDEQQFRPPLNVRGILQSDDRVWQYWLLHVLVEKWNKELVAEIQTELLTLTQLTDKEEVDIAAARARSSPDAARHDVLDGY